jgi:hypothetical protein
MDQHPPPDPLADAFVRELLRTGLAMTDALATLLESLEDEDPWPGEEPGDVLIAMAAGSIWPALRGEPRELVEQAIGLIEAVGERFMADLKLAAELAGRRESMRTR